MTKRELLVATLLALVALAAAADTAAAKGVGSIPAPGGVVVPGGEHRYVAISPGPPDALTMVAQVERHDGRLTRWWHLRGSFFVPAVAFDGTAGGLSADGGTLVLPRLTRQFPPRTSSFAVLDTERLQRRREWFRARRRAPSPAVTHISLRGDFSFDALSPDGSILYLIQRFPENNGPEYLTDYAVRAYDVDDRRLLPKPIVDPDEPQEEMAGLPLSRASSPDGRWAYTLYDGSDDEPFIHALDTVDRTAVCIDLPQLAKVKQRHHYLLHLQVRGGGRELVVLKHRLGPPAARALLTVDTESFEVAKPDVEAAGVGSAVPWPAISIAAALFLVVLAGATRGRRRGGAPA
ncbi:MAG TPA: hypothetical protein VFY04_10275 [Solirubrobacterales bacterium]|nr:hypothetical protein [Solirubrobacterales bacterium]